MHMPPFSPAFPPILRGYCEHPTGLLLSRHNWYIQHSKLHLHSRLMITLVVVQLSYDIGNPRGRRGVEAGTGVVQLIIGRVPLLLAQVLVDKDVLVLCIVAEEVRERARALERDGVVVAYADAADRAVALEPHEPSSLRQPQEFALATLHIVRRRHPEADVHP